MISFFSNIFGYILNFIYEIVKNYGLAIILFSVLLKVLLLPLTIKQQKTMKVSQKIQGELKQIQEKYKNNPEKLNQETMDLYKRENISPFSGCFASIIQLILLLAMFYLVRNPLTYMKKMDTSLINTYKNKIVTEMGENSVSTTYPEISVVKYINKKIDEIQNEDIDIKEQEKQEDTVVEAENEDEEQEEEQEIDKNLYINMNFFGLDLGSIPKENYKDVKVFIIPILYIISSFVSIKLMQVKTDKAVKTEPKNEENESQTNNKQEDMSTQMNKSMTWMMPVLAVSVSLIAPLGLALYWLVNNILIIVERIFIDKFIIPKEEGKND